MRICTTCGKCITAGMTNGEGDFYTHEGKCFTKYMNKTYGKHKWMELGVGVTDGQGGFYIHTYDGNMNGFEGTGIYWTEWEEDEDDDT